MPADLLCRVVLSNGERCGYRPEGKDRKAMLTNLFRHEFQAHLPAKTFAEHQEQSAVSEVMRSSDPELCRDGAFALHESFGKPR